MLNVEIDENVVNQLLEEEIQKKVDQLSYEKYFLTLQQLSEYLNLSIPTIKENLILKGMPSYRKGTKHLFRKHEVDEFMDNMLDSLEGTNDISFGKEVKQ